MAGIMFLLWIVLFENVEPIVVVSGILCSVACVLYSKKYLPLDKKLSDGIKIRKLFIFPFRLIYEVYASGIYVMMLIIKDSAVIDVVDIDLEITNETLKIVLAESITLTPGSLFLDLEDQRMTVLFFRPKSDHEIPNSEIQAMIKGSLEKMLLDAQL